MKRIPVQIDDESLEQLDAFASEMGLSRAAAVRLLVNKEFGDVELLEREDALKLISAKARSGHWQAMQYMADRAWERPNPENPFASFAWGGEN